MKIFYTYIHCKPNGDPFYAGKGFGNRSHKFSHRNKHHASVVKKYGRDQIQIHVFPCDSEEQAFADEIQQIAQLQREGYDLVNKTVGGEGASGLVHSEETKAKMSAAHKGLNTWMRGRKLSPDTKEKIAVAQRGKAKSPAAIAKFSATRKGHVVSLETKVKLAAKSTGNKNALGAKHTLAQCKRNSEVHKGLNKGIPLGDDRKAKISAALQGKNKSEEACKNMSKAHKGLPWSDLRRARFEQRKNHV